MEYCSRPNRSDVHLSKEEAAKMEMATKEYFDGLAPKRHTKPQRSEYAFVYYDALSNGHDNGVIPEYLAFQHLENDSQKMVCNGSEIMEEFVETEYYMDLNSIDKQHHTTGTGFIKMENKDGSSFSLKPEPPIDHHASLRGNPATNDWIPAPPDMFQVDPVSSKPNRSDI